MSESELSGGRNPIGGRRVPRLKTVQPCPACGEALGANYASCQKCHAAIEEIWLADWRALLLQEGIATGTPEEKELAQVVLAEFVRHPWTVMDIAMSLLRCSQCGGELGESYQDCAECGMAFGASLLAEFGATANEHALHIGRWVLRHHQRHSPNAVIAWRMSVPRLLTGWLPATAGAQKIMALIKAGRKQEVEQLVQELDRQINQSHD